MAKSMHYDLIWQYALRKAIGDNPMAQLDVMGEEEGGQAIHKAFQQYLVTCYCERIRRELGPAMAPQEDDDVLKLKAALIHHWTTAEVDSLDQQVLINALAGELSQFQLDEEAYGVVAYLEQLTGRPIRNPGHKHGTLSDMVKHHRPPLAD